MTSIPAPVRQLLAAQTNATNAKIDTAVMRKGMDAQQKQGDAVIAMLEQAVEVQRQLANGRLDVRV